MIEQLIKLLQKMEGDAEDILFDIHHLQAIMQTRVDEDPECSEDCYVLKVIDRIVTKMK